MPGTVTIRCTPSDAVLNTVEFSFPVAYNEYPPEQGILVQFAKPQLAPGDTTQIILKRRNPDGTLEDFSQWDSFEIGMMEGCEAGEILIGGSLGVYFEEAYQPIYFVASSNLTETDTVVVRVGLIEGIETRPVNIGGEENEFVVEGMKKKIEEPNSPGDNPPVSCIPYLIERDYAGNGGGVVGMPTIELISYANGLRKLDITSEPSMPEFPVKVEIKNDASGGSGSILLWYLTVKWKNTRQTGNPTYGAVFNGATVGSANFPVFEFDIDWENTIVGGDDLVLQVKYFGSNNTFVEKEFDLNTDILGKNPAEKETFRSYVSTQLLDPKDKHMHVILYFESTFRQFWTDNYVYMNTDEPPEVDWGVCQIRKITPTIGEIWDWKENINSGIAIFNDKYNEAIDYPPRQRTEKRWKRWYKIIYNNLTDFTTDEQIFKRNSPLVPIRALLAVDSR